MRGNVEGTLKYVVKKNISMVAQYWKYEVTSDLHNLISTIFCPPLFFFFFLFSLSELLLGPCHQIALVAVDMADELDH